MHSYIIDIIKGNKDMIALSRHISILCEDTYLSRDLNCFTYDREKWTYTLYRQMKKVKINYYFSIYLIKFTSFKEYAKASIGSVATNTGYSRITGIRIAL